MITDQPPTEGDMMSPTEQYELLTSMYFHRPSRELVLALAYLSPDFDLATPWREYTALINNEERIVWGRNRLDASKAAYTLQVRGGHVEESVTEAALHLRVRVYCDGSPIPQGIAGKVDVEIDATAIATALVAQWDRSYAAGLRALGI